MNVWECSAVILTAGAAGGFVNTLMTEGKLQVPAFHAGIFFPGFAGT
jgi:hypothetical protein